MHVRDLRLHQLETTPIGFPNCLRSRTIGQHHVQAGLHDPELDPGQHRPLVIEPATSARRRPY